VRAIEPEPEKPPDGDRKDTPEYRAFEQAAKEYGPYSVQALKALGEYHKKYPETAPEQEPLLAPGAFENLLMRLTRPSSLFKPEVPPGAGWGEFGKRAAEMYVPGVHLARHWDEMSDWEKALYIPLEAAFVGSIAAKPAMAAARAVAPKVAPAVGRVTEAARPILAEQAGAARIPKGKPAVPKAAEPAAPPPGIWATMTTEEKAAFGKIPKVSPATPGAPPAPPPVKPPAPPTGPPTPPAAGAMLPPPEDSALVAKAIASIKSAAPAREMAEAAMSKERAKRVAVAAKVLQGPEGREAWHKAMGSLKGELLTPEEVAGMRAQFTPIAEQISSQEVDQLLRMVQRHFKDKPFDWATAYTGFNKVFIGGRIPAASELNLLEEVFGPAFVESILAKRPIGERAFDLFLELWNVPRALKATGELSHSLRQGAFFVNFPKEYGRSFMVQFQALKGPEARAALYNEIMSHPKYDLAKRAGVDFTIPRVARGIVGREEPWAGSRMARKIPVVGKIVEWSDEAYTAMANKLRAEMFYRYADAWEGLNLGMGEYRKLGSMINVLSGRASLGKFNRAALILNGVFFAPRFNLGRILTLGMPLNPQFWNRRLSGLMARSIVAYTAEVVALLSLAKFTGVADVELDPRSSDFGKFRIGKTRIDPWGGLQQVVRYCAQGITGQAKTIGTGKIRDVDVAETFLRFGESKLHPSVGGLLAAKRGKTYVGEELTALKAIRNTFLPMFYDDVWDAIEEYKVSGFPLVAPGFFGVGVQTFPTIPWTGLDEYFKLETTSERNRYRKTHPEEEAKLFIAGQITTLQAPAARVHVIRLMREHNIHPKDVKGYEKVFGSLELPEVAKPAVEAPTQQPAAPKWQSVQPHLDRSMILSLNKLWYEGGKLTEAEEIALRGVYERVSFGEENFNTWLKRTLRQVFESYALEHARQLPEAVAVK